ncbi:MAG: RHS repeat-associated core domain-containing protein [Nitrospirota bacterium]
MEVTGALEEVTVLGTLQFVGGGVSATGIAYVHTDHLGSPQRRTDANQSIVWGVVYTPFGQVHSITGTATNNQRFSSRYFDQETGYHYNYFRHYDPRTDR